ncbi:MFS transporter [Sphingomonas turrisvirgatae]|jgi:predicted MFS family arabinose efflux permease|uniref:MFS transporter n=2 Tax=Sphingomonas turrisvirgatae TaxID=1888892 RepID=A0A1E3LWD6_9SPHN|nr:MFS transporter [Sphingomonas turrisvirgatae]
MPDEERERLLRVLSVATFIIFFQAFMVAPIIPRLAAEFGASPATTGQIVPAYLIPYGVATLVYGLIGDRFGLWRVMAGSLATFAILTVLTATARSIEVIALWRVLTGLGASGVVPLALVLVGRLFPYEQRGRPLGWLFGAMAGGMAFGSTVGAVAEPYIGWRGLFVGIGIAGGITLLILLGSRRLIAGAVQPVAGGVAALVAGYRALLADPRGRRTYAFVFINSVFHSGVFTWLGLYFEQRYGLGPIGIGLALLGYGVPGFLFGPMIGRAVDRQGRNRLIPIGLAIGALAAGMLVFDLPLLMAAVAVTLLSLGYDMTQPLFAGIVTSLNAQRPGQAMGLNVFMLFVGFGLGSLIFGALLGPGLGGALGLFAIIELVLGLAAIRLFKTERAAPPAGERV